MKFLHTFSAMVLSICLICPVASTAQPNREHSIDIPAQSLASALVALSEQANTPIFVQNSLLEGITSEPIQAVLSLEQALDTLLSGTSLNYEISASGIIITATPSDNDQSTRITNQQLNELTEVIVVTAQLREESLLEVPISVSVFSGDFLDNASITNTRDIAWFTPGFTASTFSSSEPILSIRGSSNTFIQASADKPVGVFLDDVYISRNSGAVFDLFDIDQVEVLRGPQGTLAGRNVTGGAIRVSTAKPSLDGTQQKYQFGIGDYGYHELKGSIDGALSKNTAGKLSFSNKKRDGFGEDRLTGQETDDLNTFNLRGQLLFLPTPSTEVLLSIGYSVDENNNRTLSNLEPGIDDGDIRTAEVGEEQNYERETISVAAHIDHEFANAGLLKSITAYRDTDVDNKFGRVGANVSLLSADFTFDDIQTEEETPKTWSQEFRFVSEDYEAFNYVAGIYYLNETIDRDVNQLRRNTNPAQPFLAQDRDFIQSVDVDSLAIYGDLQWHVTDDFDISMGGRYTRDQKDAEQLFINNLNDTVFLVSSSDSGAADNTWSKFTPRFTLSYRATPYLTLFANYAEGFTSGGYNSEALNEQSFYVGYDEETVSSTELGAKAEWFAGRLRTNLTVFDAEYKDKQEFVFDFSTFVGSIINAADATQKGVELEVGLQPLDNLNLSFSYAYLDATYDTFIATGGADFSGNFLATSPEHSASLLAEYRHSLGEHGNLLFNMSHTWTDDYFNGASNNDVESVDSFGLTNVSLNYELPNTNLRVGAWADNITDEEYRLIGSAFNTQAAHFGPPRTYGIRVMYEL